MLVHPIKLMFSSYTPPTSATAVTHLTRAAPSPPDTADTALVRAPRSPSPWRPQQPSPRWANRPTRYTTSETCCMQHTVCIESICTIQTLSAHTVHSWVGFCIPHLHCALAPRYLIEKRNLTKLPELCPGLYIAQRRRLVLIAIIKDVAHSVQQPLMQQSTLSGPLCLHARLAPVIIRVRIWA